MRRDKPGNLEFFLPLRNVQDVEVGHEAVDYENGTLTADPSMSWASERRIRALVSTTKRPDLAGSNSLYQEPLDRWLGLRVARRIPSLRKWRRAYAQRLRRQYKEPEPTSLGGQGATHLTQHWLKFVTSHAPAGKRWVKEREAFAKRLVSAAAGITPSSNDVEVLETLTRELYKERILRGHPPSWSPDANEYLTAIERWFEGQEQRQTAALEAAARERGNEVHFEHNSYAKELFGRQPPNWFAPFGNGWGRMVITTPELVERHGCANVVKKKAMEEGVQIGRLERLLTDKRVFVERVRRRGGTLLVDVSGSMHFSFDEFEYVLSKYPLATIACYSGATYWGRLVVLAQNGRRVTKSVMEDYLMELGGNAVDGPALDWLLRKQAPRMWVTDLKGTGTMGLYPQGNRENVHKAKRGNVQIVPRLEALLGKED